MVEGHNRGHSRGRCRRYGEGQLMATKWNWQKTFIWKEIPFTGTSWPSDTASHCILQCITPADFFELYISDAVIDTLVPETTKYDMQSMQQTPSNMTLSPLTKQETTVFLGLHIAMGLLTCQKSINTGWLNLLLKCDGICQWCCTTISQKSCANPPHCSDTAASNVPNPGLILTMITYTKCTLFWLPSMTIAWQLPHNIPNEHISIDEQMRCGLASFSTWQTKVWYKTSADRKNWIPLYFSGLHG